VPVDWQTRLLEAHIPLLLRFTRASPLDPASLQRRFAEIHAVFTAKDYLLALRQLEELVNAGANFPACTLFARVSGGDRLAR
jgi:hypothetical protein